MKAQGNQMTKLKVKEIVLTHPINEGKEPWPQDEVVEIESEENEEAISDEDGDAPTMEWDLTKKEDDNPDQMTLF
jgi:topoisomerase-4 subunit A